jgi:hypothetical protein
MKSILMKMKKINNSIVKILLLKEEKMKIQSLFVCMFLIFGMFGSIRFIEDNDFFTESPIVLHANIDNRVNDESLKDVKVKFVVMDSGIYGVSGTSSLKANDITSKYAYSDVYRNDLAKGEHWVRITAYSSTGQRSIKHRPIIIN